MKFGLLASSIGLREFYHELYIKSQHVSQTGFHDVMCSSLDAHLVLPRLVLV